MTTLTVSLPDLVLAYVKQRIEGGPYADASDYVSDLIHRDQVERDTRDEVAAALVEGERSGLSSRRIPEIIAAMKQDLGASRGE